MEARASRQAKIGATLLLLVGGILAYVFVLKIFARIWDSQAYLQHEYVGIASGFFLWCGSRCWARWRLPLGVICLVFCGLAFVNSTVYKTAHDWPQVAGFRTGPEVMRAMSNASVLMGCVAFALGVGLIVWQRRTERRLAKTGLECYDDR